jgi:diguanylate cyclase (GGDEF)-like protein/PAS domain S-box-containing protein
MEAAPDAMAGAEVLRKALLRAGTSRPAAVLCHYCALRPRIMGEERARSEIAEMRRLVPDALFAGFSSFGEGALSDDGVSRQNNAAIAVFVLGAELSDAAQAAREIERLRDELISQAELRLLGGALAQTEEAFLVGDGRMRITYANPAFVRLFGYPAEELIGNEVRMLVPQDEDAAGFPDAIARQVRSQGHFRGEVRRRAKDGRVIPVLLNVAPLRDASERMIGWIAAFTDISERKAAEDKLRESETRFRETFDNAPIGMGVSSIDGGRLIDANRSFCDFVGYSIEELRTLSLQDISHPEDMHLSYEGMRRLVEGGARTYVVEKRYRRKDGRDAWGQATATLVRGADGSPRYLIVVIEDIQRRKQAEAALIDAKERLGMALEASELSTWDFDIAAGTVRLDERWAAMMGLAPGATPWRIEALADMIHPEDRQEAGVAMVAALKGVAPGYQCETRMRSGDGAWRWIRCTGKVVERDAGGRALRAIGTFLDVTDRRAVEEQVRAMAFFDTLTGLPNRVLFLDRLRLAIAAARRDSKPLAVMYVDLDRFKEINDTRGHAVGDEVLREVAQRFQRVMRESDTLARLGGDEFGVVACGADKSEAAFLANRLTASLETKVQVGSESHSVGLSVGIAHYPFDGATPDLLMRNADIAMYRAKVSRGGIANYDFAMSSRLLERIALAADLKDAIDRPGGQLSLFYQPQIELRSGCAIGAEALLRWHHPKRGSIDAGTFLPLAEERGMMPVLGAWVLREACAQLRAWREAGLALPGRLAINVSAQEIEDADFERAILSAVEESGLAPTQIELELTETGMMENVDRAVEIFGRLSVRGFSLAIDDFGTGYSSLAYLKRLPVSRLKIDRSFVRDMTMDANDHAIVATVVAMGRTLGLQTVAEGVETREQADALLALGCEAAQGYLFGRPVPAGELAQNWLAQFRPESLAAR